MTLQKPREIAVRALIEHANGREYIEDIVGAELGRSAARPEDRGLILELTYGAVRWQRTLDWLISRKTQGRTQKPALTTLLRLGLYQLFWLDRIPDHAAVHESVELAKQFGCGPQSGFVNAVLRGYLREKEPTRKLLADLSAQSPALGLSHPDWLYDRWKTRWGADGAFRQMEWNNTPPRTFARVNTLRTDAAQLIERWRQRENVDFDFFQRDWTGENLVFLLKSHPPLTQLGSFNDGWFYAQDPSTLLAVTQLDPKPRESVLDLCAAPGGKTGFVAQLMNNEGTILAQDTSAERLALIRENCTRLGVSCARAEIASPETSHIRKESFDRVLIDAPCSNTGVMRRRVDLRWRIRPEEIDRLRVAQLKLLAAGADQLKPGGTLIYSTCSLEPEENGDLVGTFLTTNPLFNLDSVRELQPFRDGVDGAYVARLIKKANS